jgi:hypothetical protein
MAYSNNAETRLRRDQSQGTAEQNTRPNYGVRALWIVAAVIMIWLIAALMTRPVDKLPPQADPTASEQSRAVPPPSRQ